MPSPLDEVLAELNRVRGLGFSGYRRSMLYRRLCARMARLRCDDPELYLQILRTDPAECDRLIDNIELTARIRVALRIKRAEDELRNVTSHLEELVAQRTRQLQTSRSFLQTVIDAIPEVTMVIDREYRIVLANRAAKAAIGGSIICSTMCSSCRGSDASSIRRWKCPWTNCRAAHGVN